MTPSADSPGKKMLARCDRLFDSRKAAVAKQIVGRILKCPTLYIKLPRCDSFVLVTSRGEWLAETDIVDYLIYELHEHRISVYADFDAVTRELLDQGAPRHLFKHVEKLEVVRQRGEADSQEGDERLRESGTSAGIPV